MIILTVATAAIGAAAAIVINESMDFKKRGKRYKHHAERLVQYSPSYWSDHLRTFVQYPGKYDVYKYDNELGVVTFKRKMNHKWEITVASSDFTNPYLTLVYDEYQAGFVEEKWTRSHFDGWRGFLTIDKGGFEPISDWLRTALFRHVRELKKDGTPFEEIAEEKQTSLYQNFVQCLQNGEYTAHQEERKDLFAERTVYTRTFNLLEGTVIRWICNGKSETFEHVKNGIPRYSVKLHATTQKVLDWQIDHNTLKGIDSVEEFAMGEKELWRAVREEWEKQENKKKRIQDVWEGIEASKPVTAWHTKEKEIMVRIIGLTPFIDQLDMEDAWYIGRKLPERLQTVREQAERGSLTPKQIDRIFTHMHKCIDNIENKVKCIQELEGKTLVRLTEQD